ncbi:MAG TPA: methyltransferase domain-containing protein, partial [bacterium]
MTPDDLNYIKRLLSTDIIKSPVLELGVDYEGNTCKELMKSADIEYFGTDIKPSKNVDFVVNFEEQAVEIERYFDDRKFGSVLVLNVLEHVFEPVRVLDNVFNILMKGGTAIIITPVVWPLHNYPLDCYRINPDFYEVYCEKKDYQLIYDKFEYIGFGKVKEFINQGHHMLPCPGK